MQSTPPSLLERLRQAQEPVSWGQFVRLYTPLLFYWARRLGLQDADASDLVQDVLTQLLQKLPKFDYDRDRSFRNWLRTVLHNHWRARQRRASPVPAGGSDALAQVAAPEDSDNLTEREYREYVVRRALELMQSDFAGNTWKACWEHIACGRPAAEVAQRLGMSVGAVYVAASRVLSRLREELKGLLD